MISQINIQNFKSIKSAKVSLRNLNVLMGLNSSGKSSLIQVLLALAQSHLNESSLYLGGHSRYIDLGKMRDVLYEFAGDNTDINIGITFQNEKIENQFALNFPYQSEQNIISANKAWVNRTLTTDRDSIRDFINNIKNESLIGDNIQYLEAERTGPKDIYGTNYSIVNQRKIGNQGQFAAHCLVVYGNKRIKNKLLLHPKAKSDILLHQVDAWLSEISPGIKISVTEIPNADTVILNYEYETDINYTRPRKPKHIGFGISYTLPIIVAILVAPENRLLIIENPESHVHPSGQAALGRLMALAGQSGLQIIVETHSDHIINGFRVAVKENYIKKENILIQYFDRVSENGEQYSDITPIYIDKNGTLSSYPKGFLDEWGNQISKLI